MSTNSTYPPRAPLCFWDNDIHYDSDGENDTEFYQDQKHILDTYLDLHMDF